MNFLDWRRMWTRLPQALFPRPITIHEDDVYVDKWVCYANPMWRLELTILPGQSALIQDDACYGCILVQGHGKFGKYDCEAPTMIRYGDLTSDEFFVMRLRPRRACSLSMRARIDPWSFLKHFGPNNSGPKEVPENNLTIITLGGGKQMAYFKFGVDSLYLDREVFSTRTCGLSKRPRTWALRSSILPSPIRRPSR